MNLCGGGGDQYAVARNVLPSAHHSPPTLAPIIQTRPVLSPPGGSPLFHRCRTLAENNSKVRCFGAVFRRTILAQPF